ncbi:MAG: ABC transporter ATP-binding protein, partial [Nocardioidaceae bacterium]
FHPRCPKAFDKCGWESRDLRTLLEAHWTEVPEADYEAERATIGEVEALDVPSHTAHVPAGKDKTGVDVNDVLDRIRDADPDEPLWTGVRGRDVSGEGVEVSFSPGEDPRLRPAGDIQVACHLYPE